MAINDTLLIDQLVKNSMEIDNSADIGKGFEKFSVSQILKNYDIDAEVISKNCVDGENDGGIDYFFIDIRGKFIDSKIDFSFASEGDVINITIITCKHADTFRMSLLTDIESSINDLFNFGKNHMGSYNEELLKKTNLFKELYLNSLSLYPSLNFKIIYASRGDVSILDSNIKNKAKTIENNLCTLFSHCTAKVEFIGSTELLSLYRKTKNYNLDIKTYRSLYDTSSYVLLVALDDYYKFLKDENGKLSYYLFNSNVRDFMGFNRVNSDILQTLNNENDINFWHLNNGITIIASEVMLAGEIISMQNVQIINGLQTSYSIFEYFSNGGVSNNRYLLLRVLKESDPDKIKKIIKATNNQTSIEVASLFATDKIQQDIETRLLANGYYYERKTNHFASKGISGEEIIKPLHLARNQTAICLKIPEQAATLSQKKLVRQGVYDLVFDSHIPIDVWVYNAAILTKTRNFLSNSNTVSLNKRFYQRCIYLIDFLVTSILTKTFMYKPSDLSTNILCDYTKSVFDNILNIVSKNGKFERKEVSKKTFVNNCANDVAIRFDVSNYYEFTMFNLKKINDIL